MIKYPLFVYFITKRESRKEDAAANRGIL
jgi:hypothetical protein